MNRSHWLFAGAVALQVLILAGVPARRAYTLATGTTVLLKTAPVDPYSVMSGYYVTLGYEIANPAIIPGFHPTDDRDRPVYVVLQEGSDGIWRADSVSDKWPPAVAPGNVVIKGRANRWRVEYGIEAYFIPEGKGDEIGDGLRNNRETTRVEAKVDSFGNAALVRLHIGDRTYDY